VAEPCTTRVPEKAIFVKSVISGFYFFIMSTSLFLGSDSPVRGD